MKTCSHCKIAKPLDAFCRDRSKKDGRHTQCKPCQYRHKPSEETLAKRRQYAARYRQENADKFRAGVRSATLRKKYGIDSEGYDRLLTEQGGVCAICGAGTSRTTWTKRLHVDHNHETGEVRGLLCQPCNTTLGHFNDSADLLRKAAEYLESR
jgi:hypothetical protein